MRILYTCALTLILSGCAASGQKVTQQQIDQVQAGRTTTAQLIDLFGEPNTRVYNSDGSQILAWGYAYVGFAGIGTEVQSVSMIIGPDGTVQGYSRSGTNPYPTTSSFSKPDPIAPVSEPQSSAPLSREDYKQTQVQQLMQQSLPYDEYQKRYREIMAQ